MGKRKILITGGLGYVGGRVAKYLASDPDLALQITSRSTKLGKPDWLADGEILYWKISDENNAICQGIDTVVHFAAVNEIVSAQDPMVAMEVNAVGTLRLLLLAQAAGVRRFIYFSTAHVYGAPLIGDISEQTVPRPIHPYAITHKVAEDFVLAARDQGKIEGIVLRLSNGFGSPISDDVNRWSLLVNDLCIQAVTTGKLVLRSNGLQLRDFITLQDVGRCVKHFINLPKILCEDGLFNLGGECVLSIYKITQLVALRCLVILGFNPPIERMDSKPGDQIFKLDYSITKLKLTGFSLESRIEDEIDATLLLCKNAFGKAI